MLDPWAVQNSAWKKKIVGWLYENEHLRRAACIRALCRSELESIRAYGLDNPVCVVPNGVDLPDLPESPREEGGPRKLLFLGRIHPKKGVKELLDGWMQWQEHGGSSDWQLLIAGWDDGGHLPALKSMAARCAPKSVKFVGPVYGPRKVELLRGVDAFILPSFSEGLPMAVLEAWSYRLPVVMTRHCNLPAGFEVGAAVRVDPDGESVARGLQQLASMSLAERRAMGIRGRELVAERFTWPTVAQQMLAVYRWIWGAGTVPPCVDKG
jgi:poly(glycerol-phosphate) alpha-glucosyltransferase